MTIMLIVGAAAVVSVQQRRANVEIVSHVVKPEHLSGAVVDERKLQAPAGFTVSVFAENLGKPRVLAVGDNGTVYVTRRDPGDVVMLRDKDGDGRVDEVRTAVRRPMLHGIALDGNRAYLVSVNDIFTADVEPDGTFANVVRIVHDLPEAGQHADRTAALGPDKYLYVSVGSTCNACDETSPENATILRVSPDGKSRQIFASGLRNTIGFAWHPGGALYGFDNGIDWLGDEDQPEELNRIEQGKRYGWPYVYGNGKLNPQDEPPGDVTSEEWARLSQPPVLTYTAHAAPMQMAFYNGSQFPAEYRGDAFVAMHGSWNRKPPSGYEVVRIRFADGRPSSIEPFLTGFLTTAASGPAMIGRPMGVAVARDGALLVSDDLNGRIYRVSHRDARSTTTAPAPSEPAPAATGTAGTSAPSGNGELAMALIDARGNAALTVSSPAFTSGQPIPEPYSQYGERFSPALTWSGAPEGTRSFVLLMEDPDASQPKPFVHWVMYDIPAAATKLVESVPALLRLEDPKGAMQGRNSRGGVGYTGPRPPEGDPPHHYHFQVFALDNTLGLEPGAPREAVIAAMKGHVLGRGELVGTFQRAR